MKSYTYGLPLRAFYALAKGMGHMQDTYLLFNPPRISGQVRQGSSEINSDVEAYLLLCQLALETNRDGAWVEVLGEGLARGENLPIAFQDLPSGIKDGVQKELGESLLQGIWQLSRESDPELFWGATLQLGRSLQSGGRLSQASSIYGYLSSKNDMRYSPAAKLELEAIRGQGHLGYRSEFLLNQLSKQATDYRNILPMVAGSLAFSMGRAMVLSRMAIAPAGLTTRGVGAKAISSMVGFTGEVSSFTLASRMLVSWSGGSPAGSLPYDFVSAAITLGALKGTALLGGQVWRRAERLRGSGRMEVGRNATHAMVSQLSAGLGMLLGHRVEEALGLRSSLDRATSLVDIISTLSSLHVGMKGAYYLFPRLVNFEKGLALQVLANRQPEIQGRPSTLRIHDIQSDLQRYRGKVAAGEVLKASRDGGLLLGDRLLVQMADSKPNIPRADGLDKVLEHLQSYYGDACNLKVMEEVIIRERSRFRDVLLTPLQEKIFDHLFIKAEYENVNRMTRELGVLFPEAGKPFIAETRRKIIREFAKWLIECGHVEPNIYHNPISILALYPRARELLEQEGVKLIGDLVQRDLGFEDSPTLKDQRWQTLREISLELGKFGLPMGVSIPWWKDRAGIMGRMDFSPGWQGTFLKWVRELGGLPAMKKDSPLPMECLGGYCLGILPLKDELKVISDSLKKGEVGALQDRFSSEFLEMVIESKEMAETLEWWRQELANLESDAPNKQEMLQYQDIFYHPVSFLRLGLRANKVLERANIRLIGELVQYEDFYLNTISGNGSRITNAMQEALGRYGLRLGMRLEKWGITSEGRTAVPISPLFEGPEGRLLKNYLFKPVTFLNVNEGVVNALRRAQINTIGDLVKHTGASLLQIPGVAAKVHTIWEAVSELGLGIGKGKGTF